MMAALAEKSSLVRRVNQGLSRDPLVPWLTVTVPLTGTGVARNSVSVRPPPPDPPPQASNALPAVLTPRTAIAAVVAPVGKFVRLAKSGLPDVPISVPDAS